MQQVKGLGYDGVKFDSIPHDNRMSEGDTCWCDVATGDQQTPFGSTHHDFDEYKPE